MRLGLPVPASSWPWRRCWSAPPSYRPELLCRWLAWSEVDDHAAPDARSQPDSRVPDHAGFRAAYEVLGERDVTEAWSPNAVLDAVEARVREAGLADDAADAMIRNTPASVRSSMSRSTSSRSARRLMRLSVPRRYSWYCFVRNSTNCSRGRTRKPAPTMPPRIVAAVLAGRFVVCRESRPNSARWSYGEPGGRVGLFEARLRVCGEVRRRASSGAGYSFARAVFTKLTKSKSAPGE